MRHVPPYSQQYRFTVSPEHAGKSLIQFFNKRFSFKPQEYWLGLIQNQKILLNSKPSFPDGTLKVDDVIHTVRDDVQEPDVNDAFSILHDNQGVFVINKPAPLPVHPAGRYYKNSLIYILREQYPQKQFHTIHRLDTWTTGVLILATELDAAKYLHRQVEAQKIKKTYGVLAVGDFGDKPFTVNEAVGRVDGVQRGFGPNITEAKHAVTIFTPLFQKGEVTFLKAEPITGRTNQIRVHVQVAGGHVLNDPLYSPQKTENVPFMGLHCRNMELSAQPGEGATKFVAEWPAGFVDLLGAENLRSVCD